VLVVVAVAVGLPVVDALLLEVAVFELVGTELKVLLPVAELLNVGCDEWLQVAVPLKDPVDDAVCVPLLLAVAVREPEKLAVALEVDTLEWVADRVPDFVKLALAVLVADFVLEMDRVDEDDGVAVLVDDREGVLDGVGDRDGVLLELWDRDDVALRLGLVDGVGVLLWLMDEVGVLLGLAVRDGVLLGLAVRDGVLLGLAVRDGVLLGLAVRDGVRVTLELPLGFGPPPLGDGLGTGLLVRDPDALGPPCSTRPSSLRRCCPSCWCAPSACPPSSLASARRPKPAGEAATTSCTRVQPRTATSTTWNRAW
jgi:hypothetical protein